MIIFSLFQSTEALQPRSHLGYPGSLLILLHLCCLPLVFFSKIWCKILQLEWADQNQCTLSVHTTQKNFSFYLLSLLPLLTVRCLYDFPLVACIGASHISTVISPLCTYIGDRSDISSRLRLDLITQTPGVISIDVTRPHV